MNKLSRHIEFLLLRHDCVIVPGLGAFIATATPARIDRETRRILPPCRSVMFNQAVVLDDGLLANSYARSLSLTFEEARQIVTKDVASLLEHLHKDRKILIGRLGSLSLGEEDRLIFTPASSPESSSAMMGLSSVAFAQPIAAPSLSSDNSSTLSNNFRRKRTIIKFTAVFAVLLAFALAVIMYPVPRDSREQRASVVPVEALINSASRQPVILQEDTVAALTTPTETPAVENAADTSKPNPSHYMIVATFATTREAERFVKLHASTDFPLEVVASRKVTRVAAASSDNKAELIKQLNSPGISQKFPHAWIWTSPN